MVEPNLVKATLKNAVRLLRDGQMLLCANAFASAVFMCITATEEASKVIMLFHEDYERMVPLKGRPTFHEKKQSLMATIHLAKAIRAASLRILAEKGHIAVTADVARAMGYESAQTIDTKLLEVLDEETANRYSDYMAEELKEYKATQIALSSHHGEAEKLRKRSLYVDCDSDNGDIKTPESLSKSDATQWLHYAADSIVAAVEKIAWLRWDLLPGILTPDDIDFVVERLSPRPIKIDR